MTTKKEFDKLLKGIYKDDRLIENWKGVFSWFTKDDLYNIDDLNAKLVKRVLEKYLERYKKALCFVAEEGKNEECKPIIAVLVEKLREHIQPQIEIQFVVYVLKLKQTHKNLANNVNRVLHVDTLFKKKPEQQPFLTKLKKLYQESLTQETDTKKLKASKKQNIPLDAIIEKMKIDLNKTISGSTDTFYSGKLREIRAFKNKIREGLNQNAEVAKSLNKLSAGSNINTDLIMPHAVGVSTILENLKKDFIINGTFDANVKKDLLAILDQKGDVSSDVSSDVSCENEQEKQRKINRNAKRREKRKRKKLKQKMQKLSLANDGDKEPLQQFTKITKKTPKPIVKNKIVQKNKLDDDDSDDGWVRAGPGNFHSESDSDSDEFDAGFKKSQAV